jgi:DNA-binding LacI/PurR family transcriptional regulator
VVGFDDIRFAQYAKPPLTTICQPKLELGQMAMRCLLEILTEPSTAVKNIVLPTSLIVRGSTAPPRS